MSKVKNHCNQIFLPLGAGLAVGAASYLALNKYFTQLSSWAKSTAAGGAGIGGAVLTYALAGRVTMTIGQKVRSQLAEVKGGGPFFDAVRQKVKEAGDDRIELARALALFDPRMESNVGWAATSQLSGFSIGEELIMAGFEPSWNGFNQLIDEEGTIDWWAVDALRSQAPILLVADGRSMPLDKAAFEQILKLATEGQDETVKKLRKCVDDGEPLKLKADFTKGGWWLKSGEEKLTMPGEYFDETVTLPGCRDDAAFGAFWARGGELGAIDFSKVAGIESGDKEPAQTWAKMCMNGHRDTSVEVKPAYTFYE